MKRITLFGLLILLGLLLSGPGGVAAAGCADIADYGAVSMSLPELPRTGDYAVWVRLQSPTASVRLFIEINQSNCLEISPTNLTPNQWSWQPYLRDGRPVLLTFSQTTGHTLKVIGASDGLKIDQVIVADPNCVPYDLSAGCVAATATLQTQNVTQITPPSNGPVSGKVTLSGTPALYATNVSSVAYTVGGRTLQSTSSAEPFDTTLVANGKHTVLITTILNDGAEVRESTVIEVENPENALSPVWRWFRIHARSVNLITIIIGSLISALALLGLLKYIFMKRRLRHFHGF